MLRRTWLRNTCAALTGLLASGKAKAATPTQCEEKMRQFLTRGGYIDQNVTFHNAAGEIVGIIDLCNGKPRFRGDAQQAMQILRLADNSLLIVDDFLRSIA